jgi:NADH:ubiquinone oxidoreductase subunit 6 (subunit J)
MASVAFSVCAVCALLSALAVVRSSSLVHAVLWLGVVLLTTAALYAMLDASFLAGAQVLLYVGGVITLMIFGVMITRRHGPSEPLLEEPPSAPAAGVAAVLFVLIAWAVLTTDGLDAPGASPAPGGAADLGRALMREHVMAFETVSMLLLVAIVGAIVIARRRDAAGPTVAAQSPPPVRSSPTAVRSRDPVPEAAQ